jgi:hypothetical protein
MQINWKRGMFRTWLVASALWIFAVGWIGVSDLIADNSVRYFYDPTDDLVQDSYFGLSNASIFEKGKTVEVRGDDGISVVFLAGDGDDVLIHRTKSEQEEEQFRQRRQLEKNQAAVGAVPNWDLPDNLNEKKGRFVPDAKQGQPRPEDFGGILIGKQVKLTQTNTKPLLDRARAERRNHQFKTALRYFLIAGIPPFALLIMGMLSFWIARGFLGNSR